MLGALVVFLAMQVLRPGTSAPPTGRATTLAAFCAPPADVAKLL